MSENLTKAQQRAVQYWFVDGLAEIAAGLASLLLALFFVIWPYIIKTRWSLLIFFAVAFAVSFGLRLVIQRIKERTTYPRTGYVAPLTGFENKRALVIAVAFTVLLLAVNFYLTLQGPKALLWSPGVAGLVFAFIFSLTGYWSGLRRLYFLALFCCLTGILLVFLRIGYLTGVAVLTGLIGTILLYFGIRTRRAYLRQNPSASA